MSPDTGAEKRAKKMLAEDTRTPAQDDVTTPQNVVVAREDQGAQHWTRRRVARQALPARLRPEYAPFAQALQQAMLKEKVSASEVARRIWGTTKDSRGYDVARNRDRIGHYLAGTSYPEPENLELLAKAVGVSVEDLTIERPDPPVVPRRQVADLRLTAAVDEPTKAHLLLDRTLDWETALRILQLVKEDERQAMKTAMPPSGRSFGKPEPELRGPARGPEISMGTASL